MAGPPDDARILSQRGAGHEPGSGWVEVAVASPTGFGPSSVTGFVVRPAA
jgi:hypothetical protein